jgi:hypothetical protein
MTTTVDRVKLFFELVSEEEDHDYYSDFIVRSATQRIGQAFFNSIPVDYQRRLRGTSHDPFYSSSWMEIYDAVEFLTTK